jgi:predicted dehydrogenase
MSKDEKANRAVGMGLVGYGYWGPNVLRNAAASADTNPIMLADLNPDRLQAARSLYPALETTTSVDELLENPSIEAVAVATPVDTHYPIAKAALEAGKHVLVEKPMTSTVETAEELVALARKKGLVLMVDHVFVFSPPVRKMKEVVDSGELGELLFIDSIRINLGLFQHDINVVWDLAPHDLSIVDYILGRLPKSLSAFGAAHAGTDIEDVAYLNLDFGNGLIANFHVNWLSPVKIRYTMLGGRSKSLVYNDLDPSEKIKVYDSGITVKRDDLESRRGLLIEYRSGDIWSPHLRAMEPLREMVGHFADCVKNGKTPLTDGEAGLRVVRILDAAQRSIKAQGGRITI